MKSVLTEKSLLSGNESIARGAYEAGVAVATGYPGTPSSEILENLANYPDINAEWSVNEKVALEVAMGAAFAGARVLCAMKHVGLNVAADPLLTLSLTGTRGGIVIVSADDPSMHSSQNEQDNRYYARFAKIPMLEPSDSEEARLFTLRAFDISEEYDTPVILRVTTRICHAKGIVELGEPIPRKGSYAFERDPKKFVMIPAYARERHKIVMERLERLKQLSEIISLNRVEKGSRDLGIVTSGVAYQYVKEVFPSASVLKLGFTYPIPIAKIGQFAQTVRELAVVEELEPFLTDQIKAFGIPLKDTPSDWSLGELTPDRIAEWAGRPYEIATEKKNLLPRPPVMCPGCPHRSVYNIIRRLKLIATGDIGCYTLGTLPPLNSLDTCVCMGAGIGHAHGLDKVLPEDQRKKVVAVIGDSTFVHSGITNLIDIVYNGSSATVLILDNGTTAMTGRQDHPATGRTLKGEEAPRLSIEGICRACGVQDVRVVNPYFQKEFEKNLKEALEYPGPSVLIARAPCVLVGERWGGVQEIDIEKCKDCDLCAGTGCPAIERIDDKYRINPYLCWGCGLCAQVCPFKAIGLKDKSNKDMDLKEKT